MTEKWMPHHYNHLDAVVDLQPQGQRVDFPVAVAYTLLFSE